jgi:hypothetical protein
MNGETDEVRRVLDRMLRARCQLTPYRDALVLAGLRKRNAAQDALQRAEREGSAWPSFVQYDPRLRGIVPAECAGLEHQAVR